MKPSTLNFKTILQKLRSHYGPPAPPKITDPFELILWENVAYLVDDVRREQVFDELRNTVGLRPNEIFNASMEALDRATKLGGVSPQQRSARLKECALIALNEFGGDVGSVLKPPFAKAIKALKQFPAIGTPGAEKILLFTNTYPLLALDSNGLRVLLRVGFGEEKKNYSASYKSVRDDIADQCVNECRPLIEAHQLLRQHGKSICKTNKPRCDECPIDSTCLFFLSHS
jgi:endonuclease III